MGGDDDDKCTEHHLSRDGQPHELPRASGGCEAIGEHKAIGCGEHEQHHKHPELHQRDAAIAGPQQSWQPSHQRRYLHDGGTGEQQHRRKSDRREAVARGRCDFVRQAIDREEQRQQAARARHRQQADAALPIRSVACRRYHRSRPHGREAAARRVPRLPIRSGVRSPRATAAARRQSTAPGATAANARTASAKLPSARHEASSRRCPRRRSPRSDR